MDYDVIIVGGSYAGLSAALALVRARKRVLVVDAEQRRNRFAHAAHGFLGQDGRSPDAIARDARAEVAAYPTATFINGLALAAARADDRFTVTLADDTSQTATRLVLATGVTDELPDLPGLRAAWGNGVLHCPYCHGFEVAGQRLGVLAFGPMSAHQAHLIPEWGPTTLFTNGLLTLSEEETLALTEGGVTIEQTAVTAIGATATGIDGVTLADGRTVGLDALFIGVPTRQSSPLAAQLGCAFDETPLGPIIRTDPFGETTVPGVFAAGDAALAMKNLPNAVANGYAAGVAAHRSLIPAFR